MGEEKSFWTQEIPTPRGLRQWTLFGAVLAVLWSIFVPWCVVMDGSRWDVVVRPCLNPAIGRMNFEVFFWFTQADQVAYGPTFMQIVLLTLCVRWFHQGLGFVDRVNRYNAGRAAEAGRAT